MGIGDDNGHRIARMGVRLAEDADKAGWDRFVSERPDATFFHRFGWRRVVASSLGHRTWFLLAEEGDRIAGILPLAEVRSLLFGHRLVSLPGAVYGGIVAAGDDARAMLLEEACGLADRLGVDALEIRNRAVAEAGWPRSDVYVSFRKEISGDAERNLKAIPRKQRAMVRKGIDSGLVARVARGIEQFFPIYAESVRNLGTPVFPRSWFRLLMDEFQGSCETTVISHQGTDVAGVMSFYFRDEVLPYYAGSTRAARELRANDFMYWDLMCRSAAKGVTMFDYGRSKVGSGSYSFKKNWGFSPEPLAYEYYLVKAKAVPAINPNNPKYRSFINGWKRLPLPLANDIGPFLSRNLR
jgi:FemAB-related protein (PEP-CTERM system-associated)